MSYLTRYAISSVGPLINQLEFLKQLQEILARMQELGMTRENAGLNADDRIHYYLDLASKLPQT